MTARTSEPEEGLRARLLRELAHTGGLVWWRLWHPEPDDWLASGGLAGRAMAELWQMVGDGLVFVAMRNDQVAYWQWCLTERGRRAATGSDRFNPDDERAYLDRLRRRAGRLDATLELYLVEALAAYRGGCFLAAAVMAGVAAECAFTQVAEAFLGVLTGEQRGKLERVLADPRASYATRLDEFRKRLAPVKNLLPRGLADGLELMLNSIAELIRARRNESGHPTGARIDRADAHALLESLGHYLVTLLALRDVFPRLGDSRAGGWGLASDGDGSAPAGPARPLDSVATDG